MKLTRFTGLSPLVFGLCCGLWYSHVMAEEKPLWEVGMGVMSVQLPAYRGSVESSTEVLPIPYLVYRGEYVKADKDGLRGVLFDSDQFELNLSLAASPPVSSSKVAARHDMPDLSSTLELGSSVDVKLWQSADSTTHLKLFVPMRAAFTVERQPRYVGWQFTPRINLDLENPLGLQGWTLGSVAGPVFGSREQHEYFYGVAPQYASAQRPAYDARAGYAGLQVLTAMWKRFPSYWVGGFVRYDVSGAVFENSPLVTQRAGFSGGFAVSWVFGQSSRMVPVER
jgi:outer membrane scaffolding protein for murein synthesis (MipA/OmpV family)